MHLPLRGGSLARSARRAARRGEVNIGALRHVDELQDFPPASLCGEVKVQGRNRRAVPAALPVDAFGAEADLAQGDRQAGGAAADF